MVDLEVKFVKKEGLGVKALEDDFSMVYNEIVEMAPFPIILAKEKQQEIIYMNRQGRKFFDTNSLASYQASEHFTGWLEKLHQDGFVKDWEVVLKKKDGTELIAILSAVTIYHEEERLLLIFLNDITERKHLEEELRKQVITDSLTEIFNRRYFMERFVREVKQAEKNRKELALVLVDVDKFKQVNDTHGHQVGDIVLKKLARIFQKLLGRFDSVARIGGEEFAMILPGKDLEQAYQYAQYICLQVAESGIWCCGQFIEVTVSLGVSSYAIGDDMDSLFNRADTALYEAKMMRNCVQRKDK